MKATVNGLAVEGTAAEVAELAQLLTRAENKPQPLSQSVADPIWGQPVNGVAGKASLAAHRGQPTRSRTGYRGVHEIRPGYCWAQIGGGHPNRIRIGPFATKEEAARAYDREAIRRYGDKAITNFPKEDYR